MASRTSRPVAVSFTKSRRSTGNVVGPSTTSSWSRSKSWFSTLIAPPLHRRRGRLHRLEDPHVRAAAAQVRVEFADDVGPGGLRVPEQQRVGAHDHARACSSRTGRRGDRRRPAGSGAGGRLSPALRWSAPACPGRRRPGVAHERTAALFTITVQEPHTPSPQPNFVPVRPRSSRSTQSSGRVSSTVRRVGLPFSVKDTSRIGDLLQGDSRSVRPGRARLSSWSAGGQKKRTLAQRVLCEGGAKLLARYPDKTPAPPVWFGRFGPAATFSWPASAVPPAAT